MQKLAFCAIALTNLCLLSPAAMAADGDSSAPPPQPTATSTVQPTSFSQVDLGMQWVGGKNTGQYEQGLDVLLGFTVHKRAAWNSADNSYFDVTGLNLDVQTGNELAKNFRDKAYATSTSNYFGPSAEIYLGFGHQGVWGITASYVATSYTGNIIDSIYTVNGSTGVLNDNLAPWGGASNTPLTKGTTTAFTTATLSPHEQAFQTGTRRDMMQVGGQYIFDDWTVSTNIQHEHKQGTLEESLRQTYGGMAFTPSRFPIRYRSRL